MRPLGLTRGTVLRIDSDRGRTHGWQARVNRRAGKGLRDGRGVLRYRSAFFADRKHGGNRAACKKALAWLRRNVGAMG